MNTAARTVDVASFAAGERRDVRDMIRMSLESPAWAGWWHENNWWARAVAQQAIDGKPIPFAFRYGYLVTQRLARLELGVFPPAAAAGTSS